MLSEELLSKRLGRAGIVTLNRPKALNALTLGMVHGIVEALQSFAADPEVAHVVVRQTGERAFCAGGDIRVQHDAGKAGRFDEMMGFYRDEYRMNRLIKRYRKPYIALIDGIVMGGGAGISVNGAYRVGTEKLLFAMPEVGIGFFPDIGATWFLPRLPGELGTYCALTGERLGAADAVAAGVATHRVASARFAELLDALCLALSLGGAEKSNAERRRRLESSLAAHAAGGNKAVVVVDEAHLLPDTVLELLRLLTNIRDRRHPVVQICLVGQRARPPRGHVPLHLVEEGAHLRLAEVLHEPGAGQRGASSTGGGIGRAVEIGEMASYAVGLVYLLAAFGLGGG